MCKQQIPLVKKIWWALITCIVPRDDRVVSAGSLRLPFEKNKTTRKEKQTNDWDNTIQTTTMIIITSTINTMHQLMVGLHHHTNRNYWSWSWHNLVTQWHPPTPSRSFRCQWDRRGYTGCGQGHVYIKPKRFFCHFEWGGGPQRWCSRVP